MKVSNEETSIWHYKHIVQQKYQLTLKHKHGESGAGTKSSQERHLLNK